MTSSSPSFGAERRRELRRRRPGWTPWRLRGRARRGRAGVPLGCSRHLLQVHVARQRPERARARARAGWRASASRRAEKSPPRRRSARDAGAPGPARWGDSSSPPPPGAASSPHPTRPPRGRLHASVVHEREQLRDDARRSGPRPRPARGAASISSSRITHGVPSAHAASASRKAPRRRASASPAYGPKTSPALRATSFAPASRATATAEAVLPTPGGPCRSTPRGKDAPSAAASAAYRVGQPRTPSASAAPHPRRRCARKPRGSSGFRVLASSRVTSHARTPPRSTRRRARRARPRAPPRRRRRRRTLFAERRSFAVEANGRADGDEAVRQEAAQLKLGASPGVSKPGAKTRSDAHAGAYISRRRGKARARPSSDSPENSPGNSSSRDPETAASPACPRRPRAASWSCPGSRPRPRRTPRPPRRCPPARAVGAAVARERPGPSLRVRSGGLAGTAAADPHVHHDGVSELHAQVPNRGGAEPYPAVPGRGGACRREANLGQADRRHHAGGAAPRELAPSNCRDFFRLLPRGANEVDVGFINPPAGRPARAYFSFRTGGRRGGCRRARDDFPRHAVTREAGASPDDPRARRARFVRVRRREVR